MDSNIGHNQIVHAFAPLAEEVATLKLQDQAAKFDYATKDGNREARSYIHSLRKVKARIEEIRKAEKAESLAYGKRVDEQAKTLASTIEAMIEAHDQPLRELEARELERVQALKARVEKIQRLGSIISQNWVSLEPADMQEKYDSLANDPFSPEDWQEFAGEAKAAAALAMVEIRKGIDLKQEKLKNDAELARLRAEQQERDRKAAEEQAARDAEEAEARRIREAEQAELRRQQEERDRLAREENQRLQAQLDQERKEREAAQQREREERQARERAEQEVREAEARAERAAEEERQRVANEARAKEELEKRRLAEEAAAVERKKHAEERKQEAIKEAVRSLTIQVGKDLEDQVSDIIALIVIGKVPHIVFQVEEE